MRPYRLPGLEEWVAAFQGLMRADGISGNHKLTGIEDQKGGDTDAWRTGYVNWRHSYAALEHKKTGNANIGVPGF